jgi:hypothetical protein
MGENLGLSIGKRRASDYARIFRVQHDGKLEQVAVRQSPEHQVAEPLVEALQHWLFEPGKIDG